MSTAAEAEAAQAAQALGYANVHMSIEGKLTFRKGRNMHIIIDVHKISSISVGIETVDNNDGSVYCALYIGIPDQARERQIDRLPVAVAYKIQAEILDFLRS